MSKSIRNLLIIVFLTLLAAIFLYCSARPWMEMSAIRITNYSKNDTGQTNTIHSILARSSGTEIYYLIYEGAIYDGQGGQTKKVLIPGFYDFKFEHKGIISGLECIYVDKFEVRRGELRTLDVTGTWGTCNEDLLSTEIPYFLEN